MQVPTKSYSSLHLIIMNRKLVPYSVLQSTNLVTLRKPHCGLNHPTPFRNDRRSSERSQSDRRNIQLAPCLTGHQTLHHCIRSFRMLSTSFRVFLQMGSNKCTDIIRRLNWSKPLLDIRKIPKVFNTFQSSPKSGSCNTCSRHRVLVLTTDQTLH